MGVWWDCLVVNTPRKRCSQNEPPCSGLKSVVPFVRGKATQLLSTHSSFHDTNVLTLKKNYVHYSLKFVWQKSRSGFGEKSSFKQQVTKIDTPRRSQTIQRPNLFSGLGIIIILITEGQLLLLVRSMITELQRDPEQHSFKKPGLSVKFQRAKKVMSYSPGLVDLLSGQ